MYRLQDLEILLVEDDAQMATAVSRALETQGWRVDQTARGEQAVVSVERDDYDAMVLDIGLTGIDGFEVLRRVRAGGSAIPVLMLTARDAVEDRVRGLEGGANDYLVKPFALPELIARVRAMTRNARAESTPELTFGRLRLSREDRRAYLGDKPLEMSAREWSVLEYLLTRVGRVVSKEQIAQAVARWDETLTDNAIEVYVSRLRGRMQPAGIGIRSIRGFGYLLELVSDATKP